MSSQHAAAHRECNTAACSDAKPLTGSQGRRRRGRQGPGSGRRQAQVRGRAISTVAAGHRPNCRARGPTWPSLGLPCRALGDIGNVVGAYLHCRRCMSSTSAKATQQWEAAKLAGGVHARQQLGRQQPHARNGHALVAAVCWPWHYGAGYCT